MKFSEEYKKSAESMSPDRQTIDRMKAAVLRELQEHPDVPAEPLPEPKKPLPLRRIAYIGGAVAACAVITVAAVNIVPTLKTSNGMISSSNSLSSAAEIANGAAMPETSLIQTGTYEYPSADIMEDEAADEIPDYAFDNDTAEITGAEENPGMIGIDSAPDAAYPAEDIPADSDIADSASDDFYSEDSAENPSKGHTTPTPAVTTAAHSPSTTPSDNKINDFAPDTAEIPGTYEPSADDDKHCNPEAGWDGLPDATTDAGSMEPNIGETEEICATEEFDVTLEEWKSEEANDNGNPATGGADTIVISPMGWLTYNGDRYDSVKTAAPLDTSRRYEAYAPTEGKSYYAVINDNMLYLYDIRMNFLGGYRKR